LLLTCGACVTELPGEGDGMPGGGPGGMGGMGGMGGGMGGMGGMM
jgi:hypothetical protein